MGYHGKGKASVEAWKGHDIMDQEPRRQRSAVLLKRSIILLLALLPVSAGYNLWTIYSYTDRYKEVSAMIPVPAAAMNSEAAYQVACPDGCGAYDLWRIGQCSETAKVVERALNSDNAQGYFVLCIKGEGYAVEMAECVATDPDCIILSKPWLWVDWPAPPFFEPPAKEPEKAPYIV